jgi:DNA invertase Pin-like site-specific DNA recombinase
MLRRNRHTTEGREEPRTVLDFLREGDVLTVTRNDRLARGIGDLHDIVRVVRTRGVSLKATEQPIDQHGRWQDRRHGYCSL